MAKPKDSEMRRTGSKGRQILHYRIDSDHWEYKEETGNDFGRDCVLELSENDEWNNHKLEGQIKGTKSLMLINNGEAISFPMPVKTIEYALGSQTAFLLFVADTVNQTVYYQCVQDYFINNIDCFDRLDQGTINIHIPVSQKLPGDDSLLQGWARTTYVDGPGKQLRRYDGKQNVE